MVPVQSQLSIFWRKRDVDNPFPSGDGVSAVTTHFSSAKSDVSNPLPSHGDGTSAVATQQFLVKSDGSNTFPPGDGINAITTQHSSAALFSSYDDATKTFIKKRS